MIDYKITNTAPTEARGEWQAVSKESPCPQCQKPDWCTVGVRWIHCMRVESSRPCARGGWLHPKDADPSSALAPLPPRQKRVSDEEMAAKWGPIAAMAAKYGECRLRVLAQQLGVSEGALLRLGVGYALFDGEGAWTFPERNPEGLIVGIVRRTVVGKLCCKGSRRGLSFCDEWDEFRGPTFLCEGGSDVAAGLTLGLRIIGRPSNTGGVEMLARMLRRHHDRILVIGENDKKDIINVEQRSPHHPQNCKGCLCCWPGKAGAIQTAKALAKKLGRSVNVVMPPGTAKDLRAYLNGKGLDLTDQAACYAAGKLIRKGTW